VKGKRKFLLLVQFVSVSKAHSVPREELQKKYPTELIAFMKAM
jgi:hypothetical protein